VKGVVYGVIASAMVALNAIYIKKILPAMGDDIWKLTYFNNVNASFMFLPLIIVFEVRLELLVLSYAIAKIISGAP